MNLSAIARCLPVFATLLLATGCTVYSPMQPTISTVSKARQLEVAGSVQVTGRTEASVVYSPLPHLLVSAAGTFRPNLSVGTDSTFNTTRQGELGVGSYLPLGHGWQLTGLAGYGVGSSHRAYVEEPLIWGTRSLEAYQSRFHKTFGQLSLTHEGQRGSFGTVYRLSNITFDELNYSRSRLPHTPVLLQSMVRHEGLLFGRYTLDGANRWQLQGTAGLSVSGTPEQKTADGFDKWQANHLLLPVPVMSLGVVFRPTLKLK
jgi:hypothetical protein